MKSSNYIADKVFETNLNYVRLQNKTKELFFRCLDEDRDFEYFKAELEKLWSGVDYSYLESDLLEYEAYIHERDTGKKEQPTNVEKLFAIIPVLVIMNTDKKFQNVKLMEYTNSLKSYAYKTAKDEYLKLKVKKYNNQIVPYYSKTGELVRYVQPSTYNSMIHNTNLTRSGWNTTLHDADEMGQMQFIIPFHSFSCPHCMEYQNKILTKDDVIRLVGKVDETEGDILHPNCKCELTFYNRGIKYNKPKYSQSELEEQYEIRQKTNTLTLRKEEVLTDMKIQKSLGNQDEVDRLNQTRNRINKEIQELQSALPTAELKKQVVAINR